MKINRSSSNKDFAEFLNRLKMHNSIKEVTFANNHFTIHNESDLCIFYEKIKNISIYSGHILIELHNGVNILLSLNNNDHKIKLPMV